MNQHPVQILHVTLDLGNRQILKVGRLAWVNRRILFEYDPTFLASQLQISPFNRSAIETFLSLSHWARSTPQNSRPDHLIQRFPT